MKNNNEIKKLNNKGFSLVELIIVIAIMAVLVGVLAPQYIKYVEKSRRSADGATVSEIASAMQVLASDPDASLDSSVTYTYESAEDADTISTSSDFAELIKGYNVSGSYKLKSADFKKAEITLTLKYDSTAKAWQYSEEGVPSAD